MSILTLDKLVPQYDAEPRNKLVKKTAAKVLERTIDMFSRKSTAPTEVINRIEQIKLASSATIDDEITRIETDDALAGLLAIAHDSSLLDDTQDIPGILVDEIHDAAEKLLDWDIDQHTMRSVVALADATEVTGDAQFVEKAVEVVHATNVSFAEVLPDFVKATDNISKSGGDFSQQLRKVEADAYRTGIQTAAPKKSANLMYAPGQHTNIVPMSQRPDYEGDDPIAQYLSRPMK